jgi:putrescine transport system ATP-binding protein
VATAAPKSAAPKGQCAFAPWEDPAAKPYVELKGVTKRFGDFTAVDAVDLKIYEREFFSLLGPSGCGKSTILRMLAGFEQPTEGAIVLDGQNVAGIPPYRRPVNMMFQSYALFPHMDVWENIAFGLKQDGLPKDQITARVEEMLALVQLDPFARRKPGQLSGGQRQRVALARALAKRPKLLLLDEPLGALDKRLREQTQFELVNIQERLGLTFVIVTHDQEEAMTVSSRIAVMDKGRIIQIARPVEIYEYPNSRYVADFLGDMNIIEARVTAVDGDTIRLADGVCAEPFAIRQSVETTAGATAWVAVRPEKMRIAKGAAEPGALNTLSGTVFDIGYLGDFSIYHVKLADGRIIKAAQANARRILEREITWEDPVTISWSPDAAVVLTR